MASYQLNRNWENIEELYSQAHMRVILGEPDAKKVCEHLARVIWDVYRCSMNGHDSVGYLALSIFLAAAAVFWRDKKKCRPVVITTNYDVHLEAMMARVGRDMNHGLKVAYPWFADHQLDNCLCTFDSTGDFSDFSNKINTSATCFPV
ncbi:hypothetical protein B7486_16900 [cyanobacterium TDX16]|nr:hypothetical protein B7486_16900 [cyanobacterium TDX16]